MPGFRDLARDATMNVVAINVEMVRLRIQSLLPDYAMINSHVNVLQHSDEVGRGLMIGMEMRIATLADQRIDVEASWPEDWWEAVRERWFPSWYLAKYPVKYKHVSVHAKTYKAVCPHLQTQEQEDHVRWMYCESMKP